jgi:cbb3-type cytochrome oxidase subunit 3
MFTAAINSLAMMRFGGFRAAHSAGDAFGLFLMGVVAVGVLVWALARSDRNESARN